MSKLIGTACRNREGVAIEPNLMRAGSRSSFLLVAAMTTTRLSCSNPSIFTKELYLAAIKYTPGAAVVISMIAAPKRPHPGFPQVTEMYQAIENSKLIPTIKNSDRCTFSAYRKLKSLQKPGMK